MSVLAPPQEIHAGTNAGTVELDFRWREGVESGPPGHEGFYRHVTGQGHQTPVFQNATIEIGRFAEPLQLLAFPNGTSPVLHAEGAGEAEHTRSLSPFLTQVGAPPDRQSAGEDRMIGFWYEPPDDWLAARALDEAVVEGEFWLFVNNATVTVREDGEVVWQNWTGYQKTQDGVAAHRFEEHLLRLHLVDAKLRLQAEDRVELFGPRIDVEAAGAVTSQSVAGRLGVGERLLEFDGEPMTLEGTGQLALATRTASPSTGEGFLMLSVGEGSDFQVDGGTPIEATSGSGLPGLGAVALALGGLAVLVLAGAIAERRTGAAGRLVSAWRSRRSKTWMQRGIELSDQRAFSKAAECFAKATRLDPEQGIAWYYRALSRLEAGEHERALAVIEAARDSKAVIDELDFLEVEIETAYHLGDLERVCSALTQLAEGSEQMAASFVADLELGEEVLGPELADRLSRDDSSGSLRGYV